MSPGPAPKAASISTSEEKFAEWAVAQGVKAEALELSVFPGGLRGMRALQPVDPGAAITTVPHRLTLETTTLQRSPPASLPVGWVEERLWASSAWYIRLALLLLRELELGPASELAAWVKVLPKSFDELPMNWPESELRELQYPPLQKAVRTQVDDYGAAFDKLQASSSACKQFVTRERFVWAISVVRSRAFSGVYEGSDWDDRVAQIGFTAMLVAIGVGTHVLQPEQAINGAFAVTLTSLLRDFFLSRSGSLKRYVLCPLVDMLNHKASTQSDVSYSYFGNSFAVITSSYFPKGDEVTISYGGGRTNDQLLQLYGFVEAGTINEQYQIEDLAGALDEVLPGGISQAQLARLQAAGMVASVRNGTATADGFVDETVRAARVLLADEALIQRKGVAEVALSDDVDLMLKVNGVLADVCQAEIAALPTTLDQDLATLTSLTGPAKLAVQFRCSKKRVLLQCRDTLRASSCEVRAECRPL